MGEICTIHTTPVEYYYDYEDCREIVCTVQWGATPEVKHHLMEIPVPTTCPLKGHLDGAWLVKLAVFLPDPLYT